MLQEKDFLKDFGPRKNYIGPDAPKEDLIWQDPIPAGKKNFKIDKAKKLIKATGLKNSELIRMERLCIMFQIQ